VGASGLAVTSATPAPLLLVHGAGSVPWISFGCTFTQARAAEAAQELARPVAFRGWSIGALGAMLAAQGLKPAPHGSILLEPSPPEEVQGPAGDRGTIRLAATCRRRPRPRGLVRSHVGGRRSARLFQAPDVKREVSSRPRHYRRRRHGTRGGDENQVTPARALHRGGAPFDRQRRPGAGECAAPWSGASDQGESTCF
jgi:hypothetical protein